MFILWFLLDLLLDHVWYRRIENTLENERAQTIGRIQAAIADVREHETKNRKAQEANLIRVIEHWRGRALTAEWMCRELGHTIVPREIGFTEDKPS